MSNTNTTTTERQRLLAEMTRIEQQINALQIRMDSLAGMHADVQAALDALDEHEAYEARCAELQRERD